MQQIVVALACWASILLLAIPYVRNAKHAEARPLAAYLIVLTVFTVAAVALFSFLAGVVALLGIAAWLAHPAGAAVFLVLTLVPAFLLGRWQVRKPPRRSPRLR